MLFYVNNLYLKIRQALQFENAPPPQLLCLIFVLSSCFILLTVIHGMGCNELGITLLEIDILCLDRASVPRQRQSSIIRLNIVKKKAEL